MGCLICPLCIFRKNVSCLFTIRSWTWATSLGWHVEKLHFLAWTKYYESGIKFLHSGLKRELACLRVFWIPYRILDKSHEQGLKQFKQIFLGAKIWIFKTCNFASGDILSRHAKLGLETIWILRNFKISRHFKWVDF